MNKIFLDFNILLDLLDTKRTTSKETINFIKDLKANYKISFYTSSNFIYTTSFILRKHKNKEIIYKIKLLLEELELNLLDFKPNILTISELFLDKTNLNDLEDILMIFTAIEYNCNFFLTNDKEILKNRKDFENSISIITPNEFTRK